MVGVVSVDDFSLVEGIVGDVSELEEEDDVSVVVGVVSAVDASAEDVVVASGSGSTTFESPATTESSFIAAALLFWKARAPKNTNQLMSEKDSRLTAHEF